VSRRSWHVGVDLLLVGMILVVSLVFQQFEVAIVVLHVQVDLVSELLVLVL
jgi:hypothetical protein